MNVQSHMTVVPDTLLEFATDKNLLTCYQHAFSKRRSCLTNLLETFEAWTSASDEGFGIDVIYLDHRKAFVTVPRNRLMLKLMKLGLPGVILRWICNFITGRKMTVGLVEVFQHGQTSLVVFRKVPS